MNLNFETENWPVPTPLRSHIEQLLASIEEFGVPNTTEAKIEIYVSGDHLYNVTITLKWASFEVSANNSHYNPYLAVTTACDQLKSRTQSLI